MIKLLLVEDDESLAYIEKTGLEDIIGGYEVITAKNGKEGVKVWEETHPDVIISDIDMPVMNGFEMVERIRETDWMPITPLFETTKQARHKPSPNERLRYCSCWPRTRIMWFVEKQS